MCHLVQRLFQRLNRDAGCTGSAGNVVEELHNCMAADETFSSVQALQDAIAKDVEQRIATAHMRPPPSKPAAARGASVLNSFPGDILAKIVDTVQTVSMLEMYLGIATFNLHVWESLRVWPKQQEQMCLLNSLHDAKNELAGVFLSALTIAVAIRICRKNEKC